MNARHVLVVLAAVLLVSSSAFAVDLGDRHRPDPVAFQDTIRLGSTEVSLMELRAQNATIPRGQVFFSQYRYVVGYHGVTWMVDDLQRPDTTQQFGSPLAIYVTDYSGTEIELSEDGFIRLPADSGGDDQWTSADQASFVVGSAARTPSGPTVVPFSDPGDAQTFVEEYGGQIRDWSTVRRMEFGTASATSLGLQMARDARTTWADQTATRARSLLDRPVSNVVGRDAPTIQDAIDTAPPNTTIIVPAGTYDANITVTKPVTIRGVGSDTHLRGDGNGSVVTVYADRVALSNLRLSGVGNTTSVPDIPEDTTDWDVRVQQGYAFGDAGIVYHRANDSLAHDLTIDTPANGVVFRWSDGSVVHGITVNGSDEWEHGFMGVMDMASRIVVQDSTFQGGRDGIYTHRGHGIVVRNNTMTSMRFGVHEMYTSDTLIADNTIRDTDVGVIVMSRPTGNLIVGNDVRESDIGTTVSGSASWITENVFADNRVGMYVSARRSRYERNVVVGNEIGLRASSIIPTSQVVANDIVDNEHAAIGILGPLRIWQGNYWDTAPGVDRDGDGVIERAYEPTGAVDSRVGRVPGAEVLADSPAVAALRELQSLVPGLRGTGVIDPTPRARPVQPDVLRDRNVSTSYQTASHTTPDLVDQ